VQLNWKVGELEKRTLMRMWELIGQEIGRLGLGRLAMTTELNNDPLAWTGVYHHMGTTRMHNDPRQGVVDANGLVHGMSNIYIAGSSVFPTSGCSNPTLTIVAMALRMADHFKERLIA
jgi:choline dehydrogenase-like flavoprotein